MVDGASRQVLEWFRETLCRMGVKLNNIFIGVDVDRSLVESIYKAAPASKPDEADLEIYSRLEDLVDVGLGWLEILLPRDTPLLIGVDVDKVSFILSGDSSPKL